MLTLFLRYTIDPNKSDAFRTYVENEVPVIRASGGKVAGYYLPTDFAGPTDTGYGLIDFDDLATYEQYRQTLADDPTHQHNAAALASAGAILNIERSFIRRHG